MNTWDCGKSGGDAAATSSAGSLLPQLTLAVAQKSVYLLKLHSETGRLEVISLDGAGKGRTVALPEDAEEDAVAMDGSGRIVAAYLQRDDTQFSLLLAREGDDGAFTTVATLKDPCDAPADAVTLTGFTVAPDGRVAVGLAQRGDARASFVRSWLVQGTLQGSELKKTFAFSMLDLHGKISERYRAYVEKAGHDGFPAKPCVPLFTALCYGPGELIISGGHPLDPFLRIFDGGGHLLHSLPWHGAGGQQVTAVPQEAGGQIFAVLPEHGCVVRLSPEGEVLGMFGRPLPYDLAHISSLAANEISGSVYAITHDNGLFHLLRFTTSARFLWAQPLTPPAGLTKAQPLAVALPDNRGVLIGWRLPDRAGVSWAETVSEDGLPGVSFWHELPRLAAGRAKEINPSPMVLGAYGHLYLLRELPGGPRLQSFYLWGTLLTTFPAVIQGISAVAKDGSLAWAHMTDQGLVISRYTSDGDQQGWRLVPQAEGNAKLFPVVARHLWGWLTPAETLLKLDESMQVAAQLHVLTPEGAPLTGVTAVCGDGGKHIYLALPNRIVVAEEPAG